MSWEEYHDTVQSCRDGLRKARAHLDLNLAMDVMASKVGYYRCISRKRKTRENSYQLLNGAGDQVTGDTEDTSNQHFLHLSFYCHQENQAPETSGKPWGSKVILSRERSGKPHLNKLGIRKSMGPNGMLP